MAIEMVNKNGNGSKRNMRPSCCAFNGTHKFRANCCTGNWFAAASVSSQLPLPSISIAHCHGHIRIPRSPSRWRCRCRCESSSSLLQFYLNYFACLFMVESLISRASVADNLDVVGALRCHAACSYNLGSIHSASAVAACVATI